MKTRNRFLMFITVIIIMMLVVATAEAESLGFFDSEADEDNLNGWLKETKGRYMIANGPKGPIYGGESAVTGMILMDDGWVYGSTEATWNGKACHLFRTDGEKSEHLINVTQKLPGQVKVAGIDSGPENMIIGGTTTFNEVFEERRKYEGGQ